MSYITHIRLSYTLYKAQDAHRNWHKACDGCLVPGIRPNLTAMVWYTAHQEQYVLYLIKKRLMNC